VTLTCDAVAALQAVWEAVFGTDTEFRGTAEGLKSFAELTTPSAALRRLGAFLLMPQPPLLFKEGNVSALKQSGNSFTPSMTADSPCFQIEDGHRPPLQCYAAHAAARQQVRELCSKR